ncbi:MAG: hypothetical protein LBJ32_04495 [Oscillospiraceae bacterium]|jgi:phage tail-like protein|nr:hypothetical protein [Oscillospiraceae bacterium]
MASGTKCFTFNRKEDWTYRSLLCEAEIQQDSLSFKFNAYCSAIFFQSLDSCEQETVWHRLRINYNMPENSKLIVRLYSSDIKETSIVVGGQRRRVNLDDFFVSNYDPHVKIEAFENIGALVLDNPNDISLYSLTGRFLWICIESLNYSSLESINLHDLRIEFPRSTFIDYLPEVYQRTDNNSFFSRFISIFQNIYLETEEIIDSIPGYFEPGNNKEFLDWIGKWFGIENTIVLNKDDLSLMVSTAVETFKIKGTKRSVSEMIEKYTGEKPVIVEKFDVTQVQHYENDRQTFDALFGKNNFVFSVILHEKNIKDEKCYANILNLVENVAPINTICKLVVLSEDIFLGYHCYLGINSRISNGACRLSKKQINGKGILVVH